MRRRASILSAIAPLVLVAVVSARAPTPSSQLELLTPTPDEEQALEYFDRAIDAYVLLHRRVEQRFPPQRMFDNADEMLAARTALRDAILEERRNAKQGDVFTPEVADVLRGRLLRAILWHRHNPADILEENRAERLPGTPMPRVNKPFPWGLGAAMWPTFLRVLPELSEELEYRFVERDLILIDMHANLVLDIMDDALPAADDAEDEVSLLACAAEVPAS
jgi:hypothetical protein